CRTRSVPVKSACTDPVSDFASAKPAMSAIASMMRNSAPMTKSTSSSPCASVRPVVPSAAEMRSYSSPISSAVVSVSAPAAPVCQSRYSRTLGRLLSSPGADGGIGSRSSPPARPAGGRGARFGGRARFARLAARPIHRDDGERDAGKLLARVRLPARDDRSDVAAAGALDLERGALRDEARLIAERAQPALHEVRAEVIEEQEPAQQREGDEQQ